MSPSRPRHLPRRRGAALVIVLSILALLLGLVVAFLTRTRAERSATDAYTASSSTRRLADLTVSLVQGQVRDATSQGASVAWTSQPGMVRTFGSGSPGSFSASSSLLRVFKLYSAREMISPGYTAGVDAPPAGWSDSSALWTDLNAPVMIDDPDGGTNRVPEFPILDPAALDQVEGFDIATASAPAGTLATGPQEDWRLPMPVRWLYLLQDGRLVAPPENTGTTATIDGATEENPIIGRVAFWTDDETAKININTASEGTVWDTPRADTVEERELADKQPAQNEFQRYPGHPAMTSLAPVFFADSRTSTPALSAAQRDALYAIAPRIIGGGSDAGTQLASGAMSPDSDRLYASLDELAFSSNRSDQDSAAGLSRAKLEAAKFFLTASSQAPETTLFNSPRVAVWPVFKDLAPSRVTAFDRLIAFCSTINNQPYYFQRSDARSTTADWETIPRNRQLLRYLQALSDKPVPGFGAALVSKTTPQDRDQLLVEMLDYIRSTNLYDDNLSPTTYSSSSAAKNASQFTSGRQSDGVSVYPGHGVVAPLRVPADLADSGSYPSEPDQTSLMGFGRMHSISGAALLFICTADGSAGTASSPVSPEPDDAAAKIESNTPAENTTLDGVTLTTTQRRVQAMLFFDWFSPMQGWTQYSVDTSVDVELVGGDFSLNGVPLAFPVALTFDQINTAGDNYSPWGGYLGIRKMLFGAYGPGDNGANGTWNSYPLISDPITVDVPSGVNPTMQFQGPSLVRVKIYSQSSANRGPGDTDLVQTIEMNFPDAAFPVPQLRTKGTDAFASAPVTPMQTAWTFYSRGVKPAGNIPGRIKYTRVQCTTDYVDTAGNFIWPEDTLRTLIPYHGDYRLVAGSHVVPEGVFQPGTGYFDTSRSIPPNPLQDVDNPLPQIKNQLTGSARSNYEGGAGFYKTPAANSLVAGADYAPNNVPKFPVFVPSLAGSDVSARPFQQYGDFDNGVALTADGPYINKPDEGNNARASGVPYFGQSWVQMAGGPTFFSPNRQIPGPGMFGSLPTQLFSGNQAFTTTTANTQNTWRTLLLRPQTGHPGALNPPDHLWLDFFWMPVVEPYAISSPFATAGKINMNYAIEPFSYIERGTGLVALLRAEKLVAVPTSAADDYKAGGSALPPHSSFREDIDPHETLKQFQQRFDNGSVFLTASEICDIHLIPEGQTLNATGSDADSVMQSYWQTYGLTGDNSRERPYTDIQGRLTTKSNTYTVHYRVQSLRKSRVSEASTWDEDRDSVVGELRGAVLIERYINPNETAIPDYATLYSSSGSAAPQDLGSFYKWRVVNSREFSP